MERGDSGSSLIEAVVGISLMGMVLVGVVDASWTSTRVAAQTRHWAETSAAFVDVDRVLRTTAYSACPHIDGTYQDHLDQLVVADADVIITITHFEFWKHSTSTWIDFGSLTAAQCSSLADLTGAASVQRLGISLTENGHPPSTATFVKSRELPI